MKGKRYSNEQIIYALKRVDPAERLKYLNAQLAAAKLNKLDTTNSLVAATENSQRL